MGVPGAGRRDSHFHGSGKSCDHPTGAVVSSPADQPLADGGGVRWKGKSTLEKGLLGVVSLERCCLSMFTTQPKSSWERKAAFVRIGAGRYCGGSRKHFRWRWLRQGVASLDSPEAVLRWALPKQRRLRTCNGGCSTVLQTVGQHNSRRAMLSLLQPAWCSDKV